MALSLTLKPRERIILGDAVVCNASSHSAQLLIETSVPVLRQRDVLTEEEAQTPCGRIYFALQLLYIDASRRDQFLQLFVNLTREVVEAAPSTAPQLEAISVLVSSGAYFKAMQKAKKLMQYERELLDQAVDRSEFALRASGQ